MKVVIDTNVLMSGLFWPNGPPRKVLEAWGDGLFTAVVTSDIMMEYREVVARLSKSNPSVDVTRHLDRLLMLSDFVLSAYIRGSICSDPDDDKFIFAAVSGHAARIVTGDKALLRVGTFRKIIIQTPAAFVRGL